MNYKLVFRCKEHGHFPEDFTEYGPMALQEGQPALIPGVGDEVTCLLHDQPTSFTVTSRHFTYFNSTCEVEIDVGQPKAPKPLNLKE